MEQDDKTGEVKPGQENPLMLNSAHLFEDVNFLMEEVFYLPSPHITPAEMLKLKCKIEDYTKSDQIDGVVITHGTDTLEETAYFLDIVLTTEIPVVLTGAMRSSNELGSDGLYNLISAVRVASADEAREKGVLVVMNDEVHTAKNVTKTHTSNVSTFQSPQYGPIGIVNKKGVNFHHMPLLSERIPVTSINKNVLLLKAYAGMDEFIFDLIGNSTLDGLVIEALGQGNLPPKVAQAVQKLINRKIPVVMVSRCFNGVVQDIYAYEGGGKQLKDMGVILSNGLNGQKARIKLMLALQTTKNIEKLEQIFSH